MPDDLTNLEKYCITYNNFEILSFLIEAGVKVNDVVISTAAKRGNIFLMRYFTGKYQIPSSVLFDAISLGNIEIIKCVLEQKGIVCAKNIRMF